MARTPLTLLDGAVLTGYSINNSSFCKLSVDSGGGLDLTSDSSIQFLNNSGAQFAIISSQSAFNPTASASSYGVDIINSGSLASNLIFRIAVSALTNGFQMVQNVSSNLLYIFDNGSLSCGGATATTSGVITAGTGFRVNNLAVVGNFLRGDGTNFVAGSITGGDLPAISESQVTNLVGDLASKLSGTVGIGNGGTGNTSFTANAVIYDSGGILTSDSNFIYNGSSIITLGNAYVSGGAAGQASLDCKNASAGIYTTALQANGNYIVICRNNGAVSSFGVFGSTSAQAGGYTGLGTTSKTIATAAAATASTNVAPFGYTTAAQADAIVTAVNALIKNMCAIIGDMRGFGFIN